MRKLLVTVVALSLALAACAGSSSTASSSSATTGGKGGSGTTSKYSCEQAPSANGTTTLVASDCQPLVTIRQFTDDPANPQLPPYFRNFNQAAQNPPAGINTAGLAGIPVSGSANPTASQWAQIKNTLGANTVIVDVRAESHAIMNGDVISWFAANAGVGANDANKDRSDSQIEDNENALITLTQNTPMLSINSEQPPTTNTTLPVQSVLSEQASVQAAGLQYQREYFEDGEALKDSDVKTLIDLYRSLPPGRQIMLHCNNGWDRTTQSLTVLDIINNAPAVSLDDIAARQEKLSTVFDKILDSKRGPLMQRVYAWASANPGGSGESWDAWAKANPAPPKSSGTTQTTT